MSDLTRKLMMGAAAAARGAGEYIEDIFSTWLYTGNGSTQTITNGIDLSGEGGLVWIKSRSSGFNHAVYDTVRGATKRLATDTTDAENTYAGGVTAFSGTGFSVGNNSDVNFNNATFASWTFRKAPGFFDVVTYTGDGTGFFDGREISHNLQGLPGCIIIKRTDSTSHWVVAFRKDASNYWVARPNIPDGILNGTGGFGNEYSNSFIASSTAFKPAAIDSGQGVTNVNGASYVAYLFAHDEQIFGEDGDQSVIKCGSFTTDESGKATVDLGWEPQWVMYKAAGTSQDWVIQDSMRGFNYTGGVFQLRPNLSAAEGGNSADIAATSTGFTNTYTAGTSLFTDATYIYIAIRRGPMKTPTSGTEVLALRDQPTGAVNIGFVPDATISKWTDGAQDWFWRSRLTGQGNLYSNTTGAEGGGLGVDWDATTNTISSGLNSYINYDLGRAPGFFDVVAYTGTGVARTVSHNLGAAPELMIVKSRSAVGQWCVYSSSLGINYRLFLQLTDRGYANSSAYWNATVPTSSVFSIGTNENVNTSAATYIAYLFATLPGVSKVGYYTGTGTTLNVDCGFSAGARFVLIKRADYTGDWYVWDTARGIVSGNDPYLLLNSTAAEVTSTDYIDPLSSGFQISSTAPAAINANGGSFIFLAIA